MARICLALCRRHLSLLAYHRDPRAGHGSPAEKVTGHRPDRSHLAVRERDQSRGRRVDPRATSRRHPVRPFRVLGRGARTLRVVGGLLLLLFLLRSTGPFGSVTDVPGKKLGEGQTFSCMSSSFFASSSSLGTPCGLVWALRNSFHSSLQNDGVSLSRNPVSWICRPLMSGYIERASQLVVYEQPRAMEWKERTYRGPSIRLNMSSMTTSSSVPRISVTFPAIHLYEQELAEGPLEPNGAREQLWTYFFMTCRLTLVMSTFWLNSGGNLVVLSNLASTPVAMLSDDDHAPVEARHSGECELRFPSTGNDDVGRMMLIAPPRIDCSYAYRVNGRGWVSGHGPLLYATRQLPLLHTDMVGQLRPVQDFKGG